MYQRENVAKRNCGGEWRAHTVLSALCVCIKVFKIIKQKGPTTCVFPNWTISNKNYQIHLVLIVIGSTCPPEFVGVDVCEYLTVKCGGAILQWCLFV